VSVTVAGVLSIFSAVGNIISAPVKGWQARKSLKLENTLALSKAVNKAKIILANNGQLHDMDMEDKLIDQSGWKDEYWTIVLSIPLIMCFIPGLGTYVSDGFTVLTTTPQWYQIALGIVIGAPFGVRTIGSAVKKVTALSTTKVNKGKTNGKS